jgi:hypothetical protein
MYKYSSNSGDFLLERPRHGRDNDIKMGLSRTIYVCGLIWSIPIPCENDYGALVFRKSSEYFDQLSHS